MAECSGDMVTCMRRPCEKQLEVMREFMKARQARDTEPEEASDAS